MLHNPCLPGGPPQRVQNQKWLHHPCHLGVHQRGLKCYITPVFSGGGGGAWEGTKSEVATSPLPSRGPTSGSKYYISSMLSGAAK